jgi:hypothetical protein
MVMQSYGVYILFGILPFGAFIGGASIPPMPLSSKKAITVRILYTSDTQGYFAPCG